MSGKKARSILSVMGGVRAARVLVGLSGHRPSAKNSCVAEKLRKQKYAKPPAGMGGRRNVAVQDAFVSALSACGFKVNTEAYNAKKAKRS